MKKMIKHSTAICIVFTLLCCMSCTQQQQQQDDKLPVDVIAVPVKNGWGYEIYVDNKLFIKQDYMPAVSGVHQFTKREDALTTAQLVLNKMKAGKKPFLTTDELKDAGINIAN
jgi:hypothetical protein